VDPGDDLETRFPYECTTPHPYWTVVEWLEENIGTFDQEWYRYGGDIASGLTLTGYNIHDTYRFRNEQDAVLFRLKWS
jgi:hypothetical protein